MNKTVNTWLGIAVILAVVALVFAIYNYAMYHRIASGQIIVGTVGGEKAFGTSPAGTELPATRPTTPPARPKTTAPIKVSPKTQP